MKLSSGIPRACLRGSTFIRYILIESHVEMLQIKSFLPKCVYHEHYFCDYMRVQEFRSQDYMYRSIDFTQKQFKKLALYSLTV
jgi:hypothetical protein